MNRPINSGKRVDGVDGVYRFSVELSRFVRLDRFQGLCIHRTASRVGKATWERAVSVCFCCSCSSSRSFSSVLERRSSISTKSSRSPRRRRSAAARPTTPADKGIGECSRECADSAHCVAFNHRQPQLVCELFETPFSSLSPIPGCTHYEVQRPVRRAYYYYY